MAALTKADIAWMMAHTDDNRTPNYIAANAICIAFAIIAVSLRFTARYLAGIKFGLDDLTIAASLLFTIIYTGALFATAHYGMGRHVVPYLTDVKHFAQFAIVGETFYNVSIMFTKLSILLLYNRIFPLPWFKKTIMGLGIFIVAYSVPQMFGTIFQCVPIHYQWTPGIVPKCINYVAMIIACGVINIFTDFAILALPLPVLWRLQVSQHRKLALTFMFLIGSFVCLISIVRLFYAQKVDTVDPTWDFVWPSFISGLECCSAIVAACIPTFRPLINKVRHGVATENTVPRPTKPSTLDSKRSGGFGTPLRRLLASKRSNASATTTDSNEARLYESLGNGHDFDAKIESDVNNTHLHPEPAKQSIHVTQTFSSALSKKDPEA